VHPSEQTRAFVSGKHSYPGRAGLALGLVAVMWATGTGLSQAPQGAMQNCPQAGKWAISVWSSDSATDTGQALATCDEEGIAVAYSIDPDTQAWSRWFADRPDISTLTALDDMQGVLALGSFNPTPTIIPIPSLTPTPTFTVHFIDAGQGDAILIDSGDTDILVDGGQAFANVEDYLQAQGIDDIDLMVATHPDADHIGGLIDVLALYDVHEIWTNGDTSGSQTYGDFALAVAQEQAAGATLREVTRTHAAAFDGLDIAVLHPPSLTGDATSDSEASMLAAGLALDLDVLKVAHRRSRYSTSAPFLAAVTPEDAVISVGAGNTYSITTSRRPGP
jgi:beta-lactamase superfamily II metal-dependent hydrolase